MDTETPNTLRASTLAARLAASRGDLPAAWYWRGVVDGLEHASDVRCMERTRLACDDGCGEHYSNGLIVGIAHAFKLGAGVN